MQTRQADSPAIRTWWKAAALAVALGPLTGCAHEYPAQDVEDDSETDEEANGPVRDAGPRDAAAKDARVADARANDARASDARVDDTDSGVRRMCMMPAGETDCFYCIASECCEETLVYLEKAGPLDTCVRTCADTTSGTATDTCLQTCVDRFPVAVPYLLTQRACLKDNCSAECAE